METSNNPQKGVCSSKQDFRLMRLFLQQRRQPRAFNITSSPISRPDGKLED